MINATDGIDFFLPLPIDTMEPLIVASEEIQPMTTVGSRENQPVRVV